MKYPEYLLTGEGIQKYIELYWIGPTTFAVSLY